MIESLIYTATSRTLNIAMLNYNSSALLNSEGVFRRGSVSGFSPCHSLTFKLNIKNTF